MKRRCKIMRNAELQTKIHGLLMSGYKTGAILDTLGDDRSSRAALYRYVRQYRSELARAAAPIPPCRIVSGPSDLDALREALRKVQQVTRALGLRDVHAKEYAIRSRHDGNAPAQKNMGATPEAIELIKKKLLGLDE